MRVSVTLDPDVYEGLKDFAERNKLSMKASLDILLKAGLAEPDFVGPETAKPDEDRGSEEKA